MDKIKVFFFPSPDLSYDWHDGEVHQFVSSRFGLSIKNNSIEGMTLFRVPFQSYNQLSEPLLRSTLTSAHKSYKHCSPEHSLCFRQCATRNFATRFVQFASSKSIITVHKKC